MRRFVVALSLLLALPGGAEAACSINVDTLRGDLQDQMFEYAECVNKELAALKREQDRLKQLLGEYGQALGELPAPYLNEDGKVSRTEDRAVGKATFVLTARQNGGASSLAVDQDVLRELCARGGGCAMSITLNVYDLRGGAPVESIPSGPCQLTYSGSGAWTRGPGCDGPETGRGVDGNGAEVTAEAGGEVVATSGEACILADADAERRTGAAELLSRDRAPGLFLIAASSLRGTASRRFKCELVLE